MQIDKTDKTERLRASFVVEQQGYRHFFLTLLFANPQHLMQHYIESRTLSPTRVKVR